MATVEQITQRIRDIYDVIPGLTVFQFVPRTVTSTSLPCVIVWPGGMNPANPRTGAADVSQSMNWTGIVLLEEARLGTAGQAEDEAQTFDIFGKVATQFFGRRRLQWSLDGLDQGIVENALLSHVGLIQQAYPFNSNNFYLGTNFTHIVNFVGYYPELFT